MGTHGVVLGGWVEVEQQVGLDGRDGVGLEVRVVPGVQLCGDAEVIRVGDHHVDVRGPVWMPVHHLQQHRAGTRCVDGVLGRLQAVEPEAALLVRLELAAQVVTRLVLRVKDVVLAVGAGLPHVENGTRNALAGFDIPDDAVEPGQLTIGGHVLHARGAEVAEGRLGGPEGAQNGGRCGSLAIWGDDLVVDLINKAVLGSGFVSAKQINTQEGICVIFVAG